MADRTGQQLDNYRLLLLLGQGTFGEVYLAEHLHKQTRVAVKVLTASFSQEMLENFLHETRTLFLLKHPHIVPLIDFGLTDKTPFLVFKYAPNGTLSQRHRSGARLDINSVNSYVQQVASALQYAHEQRLIHRDVKPQNMLLDQQREVLLSDFGIAAIAHSEGSLKTQEMAGTIPYMAPEQLQGKPRPASDQYALAVCVYEWLCGTRPFTGSTWEIVGQHISAEPPALRGHLPDLSREVEEVVLRALAKDPQQRFASVGAFANAFQQASQPTSTHPATETSAPSSSAPPGVDLLAQSVSEMSFPPALEVRNTLQHTSHSSFASVQTGQPIPPTQQIVYPSTPGFIASTFPERETQITQKPYPFPEHTTLTAHLMTAPTDHPRRSWSAGKFLLLASLSILVLSGILAAFFVQRNAAGTISASSQVQALTTANVSRLVKKWTYQTGNWIVSSPTVANGVVYIGSEDNNLYAINATTGQQIWAFQTGNYIQSSPTVANNVVYVGSEDNNLYAVSATTGQQIWASPIGNAGTFNPRDSSPTVANNIVYVGSSDNNLYAFNATTGHKLWAFRMGNLVDSSPTVANGVVYAAQMITISMPSMPRLGTSSGPFKRKAM